MRYPRRLKKAERKAKVSESRDERREVASKENAPKKGYSHLSGIERMSAMCMCFQSCRREGFESVSTRRRAGRANYARGSLPTYAPEEEQAVQDLPRSTPSG